MSKYDPTPKTWFFLILVLMFLWCLAFCVRRADAGTVSISKDITSIVCPIEEQRLPNIEKVEFVGVETVQELYHEILSSLRTHKKKAKNFGEEPHIIILEETFDEWVWLELEEIVKSEGDLRIDKGEISIIKNGLYVPTYNFSLIE